MKLIQALTNEIHPAQWVEIFNSKEEITDSAPCEALADRIRGTSRADAEVDSINHFTKAAYIKIR